MAIVGGGAMVFPDWVAITVLVLLLVGAASAWIWQHKSALMQQTKNPPFQSAQPKNGAIGLTPKSA